MQYVYTSDDPYQTSCAHEQKTGGLQCSVMVNGHGYNGQQQQKKRHL